MDTDGHNPSTSDNTTTDIPISVTVTTELEPVTADGIFRRTDGGFCVMFSAGNVQYILTHSAEITDLKTVGDQSYEIVLRDKPTHTTVLTPFGSIGLKVTPVARTVTELDGGLDINLQYTLGSEETGVIPRTVHIAVRFKGTI